MQLASTCNLIWYQSGRPSRSSLPLPSPPEAISLPGGGHRFFFLSLRRHRRSSSSSKKHVILLRSDLTSMMGALHMAAPTAAGLDRSPVHHRRRLCRPCHGCASSACRRHRGDGPLHRSTSSLTHGHRRCVWGRRRSASCCRPDSSLPPPPHGLPLCGRRRPRTNAPASRSHCALAGPFLHRLLQFCLSNSSVSFSR